MPRSLFTLSLSCLLLSMLPACGGEDSEQGKSLVIRNPAIDLSQYTVATVEERRNHPDAGELEYAYLRRGKEAVTVPGPSLESPDGALFKLEGEEILTSPQPPYRDPADSFLDNPFRVRVNPRLSFDVMADDFEDEVQLAQVELIREGSSIQTVFTFTGHPSETGVAHDMTITPIVDGTRGTPSEPVTIECR
jgi:hypothetical protein